MWLIKPISDYHNDNHCNTKNLPFVIDALYPTKYIPNFACTTSNNISMFRQTVYWSLVSCHLPTSHSIPYDKDRYYSIFEIE